MKEHTALVIAVREALKQTSMRKLAAKAGVSHTTISAIIGGKSADVSLSTYQALMDATATESNMRKPVTTHDHASASFEQVEQLAAQRVNADLTHHADWDVDLQCAKYRRVMQLEKELGQSKAEVGIVREQRNKLAFACEQLTADLEAEKRNFAALEQVHERREQHLKSCENALIEAHEKITKQDAWIEQEDGARNILQSNLRDASAEIKRLTALSETHGQSWKAACVQVEQLQKQLDHGQAQFKSLHDAYNQQVDDEAEMLAQIDKLFAERDNMRTEYEYSSMRLRVTCFALVCAIVFLIVSNLVVWGGV